jgi:hypothetical protein
MRHDRANVESMRGQVQRIEQKYIEGHSGISTLLSQ